MADGTLKVGTITNSAGSGNITIGSGVTLLSNTPAFEAYLSSNQTVASNDTSVKAQIDTEVFDTDNCYDNSTNYRFTPTVAGKYNVNFFSVGASASGNSDCDKVIVSLYKNGSSYRESLVNFQNNDGNSSFFFFFVVVDMNGSTDYLEVNVRIDSSGGGTGQINASNRTWFGAYRIGA